MDNDGDLDLVVNNVNEQAYIYRNNSEKSKNNFIRLKLKDNKPTFGTKVSLYKDDHFQYFETTNVRGIYSNSEDIVHFGLGKYSSVDSIVIEWPDQKIQTIYSPKNKQASRDKKESQIKIQNELVKPKIFTEDKLTPQHSHKENYFDDYEKQVFASHKLSQLGPALSKGDVNGDGLEDLFVGGASGQNASIYIQLEDQTFIEIKNEIFQRHRSLEDVDAVFDSDNDGDQDLYVVTGGNEFAPNSSAYLDRLYINDGNGNFKFERAFLPEIYESGATVKPLILIMMEIWIYLLDLE